MKLRVKGGDKKVPKGDPSETFSNFANTNDTKVSSKYLLDKGMIGADQMMNESQNTSTPDAIINQNQSDWKVGAIQKILQKAYLKNIRNPTVFLAPENRNYLLSGLDPRIKDAINDPRFSIIHPNFWQVLGNSVLKDQWSKNDAAANQIVAK